MLGGGSGDGKKLCYVLRQLENTVPSWRFGTPTFICLIVVDEVRQEGHSKSLDRSLIIFKYFLLSQMIWGQNLWHINDPQQGAMRQPPGEGLYTNFLI